MAATHSLESRGQASLAGFKHSQARQPLTPWRAEGGVVSMPNMQQGTATTHRLERQGQASSVGLKSSHALQPLTSWRTKDRCCQQALNAARHGSDSPTREPRTGIVSRLETQPGAAATHQLECKETGVISRLETQPGTAATHSLEN